jgi:4-amino-4-deoxy-L-arabinose transferase-like glycosyltransferase
MQHIPKKNIALALIFFSVLIILSRIQAYDGLLGVDTVTYAIMGNELLEGRALYSDLWDHKPPAIHLTFAAAQAMVGFGSQSFFLLNVVAAILTLLGVYSAASTGGRGPITGLWAAAIWAAISRQIYLGTDSPNTEEFINVCVIWAFALFLQAGEAFRDWKKVLIVGGLFALASLYKPIAVVVAILFSLVYLLFSSVKSSKPFLHVSIMAAVGVGAWVMTAGYFFFQNRFDDFYYAVFEFNRNYAGNLFQNIVSGFQLDRLFPKYLYPLSLLFVIASLGLLLSLRKGISRSQAMMAAYVVSVFIMVSLPGRFFGHYYQLWLPVLSVATAWSLTSLSRAYKDNSQRMLKIAGSVVLIITIGIQLFSYAQYEKWWSKSNHGAYAVLKQLAIKINVLLLPEETFHAWGSSVGLFYYTGRSPQTGLIATWIFKRGSQAPLFWERVKGELSNPPVDIMVVDSLSKRVIPNFNDVLSNYRRFPDNKKFPPFELYYLKDSALEKRLLNSQPLSDNVDG